MGLQLVDRGSASQPQNSYAAKMKKDLDRGISRGLVTVGGILDYARCTIVNPKTVTIL